MKKILIIWNRFGIWVAGLTLLLMMSLTAIDVFSRYIFKNPITGVSDLTELMMVMIIFFALSDTTSSDGHITVEVVTSQLSKGKQKVLKASASFISGIGIGIVAWRIGVNAVYTFQFPESTPVLDISKAPFLVLSTLGCAMTSIALIVISYDTLKSLFDNRGI